MPKKIHFNDTQIKDIIEKYDTTKTKIQNHCNTNRLCVTVNAIHILNDLYYKRCVSLERKNILVKIMTIGCHA